jgi:surfactin synthase thioesterase subunit
VFGSLATQIIKIENLEFQPNTHIVAVYYNGGNANLFRVHVDVTLGDLKHQLTQLNGRVTHHDQRRVTDVEYRGPSVC